MNRAGHLRDSKRKRWGSRLRRAEDDEAAIGRGWPRGAFEQVVLGDLRASLEGIVVFRAHFHWPKGNTELRSFTQQIFIGAYRVRLWQG